jgi:hypothetical protein
VKRPCKTPPEIGLDRRDAWSAIVVRERRSMVTDAEPRPTLVLNPSDDEGFRLDVEASIESGIVEPTMLQERLRDHYPNAVVRPRELSGERALVWYVYRQGHWVRPGA